MGRWPGFGIIIGTLVMFVIWLGNMFPVFAGSVYNCSQGAHKYDVTIVKAAQEEEDGVRSYSCLLCDYSYTEVIPRYGHIHGEWMVEREASCTQPGSRYSICARYGHQAGHQEEIPALGHQYDRWKTIRKAKVGEKGIKGQVCTRCGLENKIEIPALIKASGLSGEPVQKGWSITLGQVIRGLDLLVFLIFGFLIWSDVQVLIWYRRVTKKGSGSYV